MADLAYRTVYAMNRVEARMQLVQFYVKSDGNRNDGLWTPESCDRI